MTAFAQCVEEVSHLLVRVALRANLLVICKSLLSLRGSAQNNINPIDP